MNGVSTKQNGGGNLCHRSQPGLDRALGALGLLFQFAMRGHVLGEAVSVRIQLMLQKGTVLPQSLFAFILSVTKCHLIYISSVF